MEELREGAGLLRQRASPSLCPHIHPILQLSVGGTETDGDGKGCDWSPNKIISRITFPGLTSQFIITNKIRKALNVYPSQ